MCVDTDLEGATPIRLGPKPLNRALGPSVSTICLMHRHRLTVCLVGSVVAVSVGVSSCADWPPLKQATDDWSRVLTTSSGQVTMAPMVPPTLNAFNWLAHDGSSVDRQDTYPPANKWINVSNDDIKGVVQY